MDSVTTVNCHMFTSHINKTSFFTLNSSFCITAPICRDFKKANVTLFLVYLVGIKRKKMGVRYRLSTQYDRKTLQFQRRHQIGFSFGKQLRKDKSLFPDLISRFISNDDSLAVELMPSQNAVMEAVHGKALVERITPAQHKTQACPSWEHRYPSNVFKGFIFVFCQYICWSLCLLLSSSSENFLVSSTYYSNLASDMSSQSGDLHEDIYGGHQSSCKYIKEFLHTERQSLRNGCQTCGQGLHLPYLP